MGKGWDRDEDGDGDRDGGGGGGGAAMGMRMAGIDMEDEDGDLQSYTFHIEYRTGKRLVMRTVYNASTKVDAGKGGEFHVCKEFANLLPTWENGWGW